MLVTLLVPVAAALKEFVSQWIDQRRRAVQQRKIDAVEERALAEPDKPQLAWDLARSKLERYLDRNLSQTRSVLTLTYIVMFLGFALVLFGLYRSFDSSSNLTVTVVGSASGVIISFIGGSFLLVYKSVLAQTKDYVAVLERINAVGMAVQVLSGIPEDQSDLKHKTTAKLACDLITLYGDRQDETRNKRAPVRRAAKST